jgi:hypothetical protein
LTNKLNAAGISVKDMGAAQAGGAANQRAFQSQVDSATKAVGDQQVTIEGNTAASEALGYGSQSTTKSIAELADAVAHGDLQIGYLTDSQQQAVTHFQAMQTGSKTVADQFSKNASAAQAAAGVNAQATQLTADQQAAAAVMAKQYGLSVDAVAAAFATLPGAGSAADGAVGQVTSAFNNGEIALKNAQQATSDYFSSLQTNAAQANNAVVNANHSYQQSVASVADAEHGAAQAADGVVTARRAVTDATNSAAQSELSYEASQRAVEDAESGVTAAERTLAQAQVSETQAQKTLTDARQAAVEQLKSMQLQLADQVASEQAAEIKLFDAKNTAGGQNINTGNVDSILAAPLTASNEAQKKAALDLKDAVNALADSLDQGAQLREKVTAANQAGVAGNPAVVSATQALASAQSQVNAASVGVTKAHQAVADAVNAEQQALYNLGKAQQAIADAQKGVSTAVYNEQKARSAVKDAIFAERQALLSLNDAQAAAKKANDLNTTSLDLNTQAGRNNWAQLQTNFAAIPAWVIGNARYKQMVDDTAIAFGGSKQAAADFLKAQGAIPHTFDYSVNAVASVNTAALDGYFKGAIRSPGGRLMMAGGGHVRGPGGPTSDDVNAKLSDNEFVEPSHVVDHYGVPFFEALRQKKIPKPVGGDGASLPGFASGGLFDSNAVGAVAGADFESYRNALGFLGFPQPPQMPAYAPDAGGNLNFTGTPGVNQWAPQVLQVLGMLGQPASLLPNVLRRMNQESSGNPTIVNTWDSNAKAGHPSVGLMQVIRGTFRSNAGPYVNTGPFIDGVSVDPVANIYAGLEHAINSYPSLQYAMDKPGGYDSGGYMLNKPALNSSGKPEMVLPPGMTNTMERLNTAMQSGGGSTPNGAGDVTHNWNITINGADMPDEQLASAVTSEVTWRLGAMS